MSKFTPTKRAASSSPGPAPVKARGRLSSLSMTDAAFSPKPKTAGQSRPANAPIVLTIYKYTADASDVVTTFRADEPLWAVRVEHGAYPSVESGAIAGMNAFLTDMHGENQAMPKDLQELRKNEQIIVQIGRNGPQNVDALPIKEFSLIYYIGGTLDQLKNGLHLLVEFF